MLKMSIIIIPIFTGMEHRLETSFMQLNIFFCVISIKNKVNFLKYKLAGIFVYYLMVFSCVENE